MIVIWYLFRRLPRPFKFLLALMVIVFVIESVAHTFSLYRYSQERQQHVHSRHDSR